ncbi:MAG: ABC transporter substrate-binding protein [Acidobacteria bacterium]|nr:ABC transporter substrate-binding protein [Acidobacteriota bacterium]
MTKGILAVEDEIRIASLLPSATEIVAALGFEARLVGRSHECDFPESVERLPVLTRSRTQPAGSSAEIDRQVREQARRNAAEEALGVYEVLAEELQRARPTHIVTQTLCEVCAVSLRDVERAVRQRTGVEARVVPLAGTDLPGVMADFLEVAEALGDIAAGERLAARCNERLAELGAAAGKLEAVSVLQLEWLDPPMSAGHWTPELIQTAGGLCLLGDEGGKSKRLDAAAVAEADPDVLLLAPCGFALERTRAELPALLASEPWRGLRAVREGRVFLADGQQYFNRPGPRLVESGEILAEILHPNAFDFGHKGRGWLAAGTP